MMNLAELIALATTYEQAERLYETGRITRGTWRRYLALWQFSAVRSMAAADVRQTRFYERAGRAAFWRRIDANARIVRNIAARAAA